MSATSESRKEEPLYCGKVEIKTKELTVSIYSDGYSLNDIIKSGGKPKDEFKEPVEWKEYLLKLEDYLSKLKGEIKNLPPDRSELLEEWKDEVKNNYDRRKIEGFIESLKRLIQKFNPHIKEELEIILYEPPLQFEKKRENGKFVHHLKVNKEKAILITSYEEDLLSFPLRFQENALYYLIINEGKKEENNFKLELSPYGVSPPHVIIPYKGGTNSWTINFGNMLFYGSLYVFEKNTDTLKIQVPVLVFPKKLEPLEAIEIVEELLKLHSDLILEYTEATGLTISPGEIGRKNPIQILKLLQTIWEKFNLEQVLQNIIDNPHKVLLTEEKLKNIEEITVLSPFRMFDVITSGECLKRVSNGGHINFEGKEFQFTKAYDEEARISYDTYPNRFVKFFLKFILFLLNTCLNDLNRRDEEGETNFKTFLKSLIEESNRMRENTLRFLSRDFFYEVSDLRHLTQPPQVLLKEERYKTIFKSYLDIIRGIITDDELEELLKDPIKNMPELYEYWCFLKMIDLLRREKKHIIFKIKEKGIEEKGAISIERWKVEVTGDKTGDKEKVSLVYQKRISKNGKVYSYTLPFVPDMFLTSKDKIIIFDAKYRVDLIEEFKELDDEKINELKREEKRGTFKLGDLYKMHTYREAIRKKGENLKDGKPLWVIALYPGDKIALFSETGEKIETEILEELEKKKESLKCGGVGALPFRPKLFSDEEYKKVLNQFFEIVFERK